MLKFYLNGTLTGRTTPLLLEASVGKLYDLRFNLCWLHLGTAVEEEVFGVFVSFDLADEDTGNLAVSLG